MAHRRRSIEEREPTLRPAPGGSEYWYFLSHKKEHSQHGRVPAAIAQSLHDSLHQLGYRSQLVPVGNPYVNFPSAIIGMERGPDLRIDRVKAINLACAVVQDVPVVAGYGRAGAFRQVQSRCLAGGARALLVAVPVARDAHDAAIQPLGLAPAPRRAVGRRVAPIVICLVLPDLFGASAVASHCRACHNERPARPAPIWVAHGHPRHDAADTVSTVRHPIRHRRRRRLPGEGPEAGELERQEEEHLLVPVRAVQRRSLSRDLACRCNCSRAARSRPRSRRPSRSCRLARRSPSTEDGA